MEKILILGGTNFIGRNLVEQLILKDTYDLTLLNRGQTNTGLFSNIKQIRGDRNTDEISDLIKGNWDYIIDLSCYFPKSLAPILASVTDNLKKYIFISTCSVYQLGGKIPIKESGTLKTYQPEDLEDQTDRTYGQRKVACEDLLKSSEVNYTILRPSLVYGKNDHTDRFYYWLHQVKKYQKILIPNDGQQKKSMTYEVDLITAIIESINQKTDKEACNIVSFPAMSIKQIVEKTSQLLNKFPDLINIPASYLYEKKIYPWVDIPIWVDSDYFVCDNQKMQEKYDFNSISFEKSVKDTITYYQTLNWSKPKSGISRNKQLRLINNYNK